MNTDKARQLDEIAQEVRKLAKSPLYAHRKEKGYQPVIGEGDPDAEIMFIGEAPGEREATTGRPFVGNAGNVLDKLLESAGINRKEVYITNIVKDRPPGNRDPRANEIALYAPFLIRQIEIIQPKVIATLGRIATDWILDHYGLPEQEAKIGDLHGQILEAEAEYGQIAIVPLYHPAAGFYNQNLVDLMKEDYEALRQFI